MDNRIKCKVDQCVYNCDQRCEAACIEVCNCGCQEAKHSDETECKTFRDRKEQRSI